MDQKRREDINVYTDIILSSENCGKKYMAVKKLYELMPNDFNVLLLLISKSCYNSGFILKFKPFIAFYNANIWNKSKLIGHI